MITRFLFRRYSIFLIALVVSYLQSVGQDSTSVKIESLTAAVIQYTPYYSQSVNSAGTYVKVVQDSNLVKYNPGISVYNYLRGRVPNLVISPYAVLSAPGFRSEYYGTQAATVMVDGVPFNGVIGSYLNMNAWEYSSITASPSTLALAFLDLPSNGIINLTSKSGAGYKKLAIEFNTTPLVGVRELQGGRGGNSVTYEDWHWSNSLALMKDFGDTDVRVSFNLLAPRVKPDLGGLKIPTSHYVNLNLGHRLGDRGEVRLITNSTLRPQSESYDRPATPSLPAESGRVESKLLFLNLNLTARYRFTNWLGLTAQTVLTAQDSSYEAQSSIINNRTTETSDGQKRANLHVTLNKKIKHFALTGFAGVQYLWLQTDRNRTFGQLSADFSQTFDRTYAAGGTSASYKDFANASVMVKVPLSESDETNYSVAGSVLFAQVIKLPWLSAGKIRGATGKNYFTDYSSYPYQQFNDSQPLGRTRPITSYEWGADFGFFQNKLEVQVTRFNDKWSGAFEIVRKGVESSLAYSFVQRNSSTLKTQLITAWINEGNDFRGSVLVDYLYKNFFVSAMAERVSISYFFANQNFTRLRDLSVGFSLQPEWLTKANIRVINLSFSARNIYDFGGESLNDYEVVNFEFIKSYMGSLTIKF